MSSDHCDGAMRKTAASKPIASTRERILQAAMLRFSKASYEETGLRDIAADVGVDVAYVHRCFGSKERLFAEVIASLLQTRRFLEDNRGDLASGLTTRAFARAPRTSEEVSPIDVIVRSMMSPAAAPVLRDYLCQEVIDPLAVKLKHSDNRRASVIAALLVGTGILRGVLRIEPMTEPEGGPLEAIIEQAIAFMAEGERDTAQPRKNKG